MSTNGISQKGLSSDGGTLYIIEIAAGQPESILSSHVGIKGGASAIIERSVALLGLLGGGRQCRNGILGGLKDFLREVHSDGRDREGRKK